MRLTKLCQDSCLFEYYQVLSKYDMHLRKNPHVQNSQSNLDITYSMNISKFLNF